MQLNKNFALEGSSVFKINFCAKNPPLRKAENRQIVKKLQLKPFRIKN